MLLKACCRMQDPIIVGSLGECLVNVASTHWDLTGQCKSHTWHIHKGVGARGGWVLNLNKHSRMRSERSAKFGQTQGYCASKTRRGF